MEFYFKDIGISDDKLSIAINDICDTNTKICLSVNRFKADSKSGFNICVSM